MRVAVYGLWHLGCVTAACLAEGGHDVIGLDTGFYREAQLYRGVDEQAHTLFKDIRRATVADFEGVDADDEDALVDRGSGSLDEERSQKRGDHAATAPKTRVAIRS